MLFVVVEVAAGWFDIASEGGDRDPERLASLRLAAERQVAEALARLPWVPEVRTEVVEGPFGPAVAERVGLGDFDAVVIEAGGRGRGGRLSASAELFRLLGGEAPPAVLLVPTPPDASATGREGRD